VPNTTPASGLYDHVVSPRNAGHMESPDATGKASRPIAETNALGNTSTTVYDAAGRTQARIDALGNRTTFSYNANNRRATKVSGSTVTNHLWDEVNDTILMDTNVSGTPTAVYTNEPGQFGGLISERQGGQSQYYHFDVIGSTRQLTNSTGQVTDSYLYDAFGNTVQSTGTSVVPYHFVGRAGYYYDAELAEYYVRARHYAPQPARWLSEDPVQYEAGDSNLYRYVLDNPTNATDPPGNWRWFGWFRKGEDEDDWAEKYKKWLETIKTCKGFWDAIKENPPLFSPGGLLSAMGGKLDEHIGAVIDALAQFKDESPCGMWYKSAMLAIYNAGTKGDEKGCADISAKLGATATSGDKCAFEITCCTGLGYTVGDKFAAMAQKLSTDCISLAHQKKYGMMKPGGVNYCAYGHVPCATGFALRRCVRHAKPTCGAGARPDFSVEETEADAICFGRCGM